MMYKRINTAFMIVLCCDNILLGTELRNPIGQPMFLGMYFYEEPLENDV